MPAIAKKPAAKSAKKVAAEKPADKPKTDAGKSVVLGKEKDCKHSVKYGSPEFGLPVDNAYVNRVAFPGGMPERVRVTIYAPGDVPEGLPNAVVLARKKDCKHSVHYEKVGDANAALTSLYVNRTAFPDMPAAVAVGVEPA